VLAYSDVKNCGVSAAVDHKSLSVFPWRFCCQGARMAIEKIA
jgi:hypothetical protein